MERVQRTTFVATFWKHMVLTVLELFVWVGVPPGVARYLIGS
jgi:hypothetical protein